MMPQRTLDPLSLLCGAASPDVPSMESSSRLANPPLVRMRRRSEVRTRRGDLFANCPSLDPLAAAYVALEPVVSPVKTRIFSPFTHAYTKRLTT